VSVGHSSRHVLDPVERMSEILFGLIMVLTFTGSLSVATAGHEEVRGLLIGAIGCNLAWGLIDAVMYLLTILVERGRIALDDPVAKYIPEFAKLPTTKPLTVFHLLTHTSGLTVDGDAFWAAWDANTEKTTTTAMARSLAAPRYEPPGIVRRLMEEGKRGARDGEGLYDWRGRDLAAYQRELAARFVALFRHLSMLPPPGAARR